MTQPPKKPQTEPTVRQDEFRRDPGAAVRQAIATGRVVITDASGKPLGVISSPMDRREVVDD